MSKFSFKIKILGLTLFCIEIKKKYDDNHNVDIFKYSDINKKKKMTEYLNQHNDKTGNLSAKTDIKYKGAVRPDLKDLEKKLNPIEEIPAILVTCEACGAKTYDDDLTICSCGKTICSVCGSYDAVSGESYCKECWEKI